MMEALYAIPGIGPALPYITLAVAVASALGSVIPAPDATSSWVQVAIYRLVNVLAINFGHARNAADPAGNKAP